MYHIFFIHSSVDGHLGCFHVLVIVNSGTRQFKFLPKHDSNASKDITVLEQCCPKELSVIMEKLYICIVQMIATSHTQLAGYLKCGQCDKENEFLILFNFN